MASMKPKDTCGVTLRRPNTSLPRLATPSHALTRLTTESETCVILIR